MWIKNLSLKSINGPIYYYWIYTENLNSKNMFIKNPIVYLILVIQHWTVSIWITWNFAVLAIRIFIMLVLVVVTTSIYFSSIRILSVCICPVMYLVRSVEACLTIKLYIHMKSILINSIHESMRYIFSYTNTVCINIVIAFVLVLTTRNQLKRRSYCREWTIYILI